MNILLQSFLFLAPALGSNLIARAGIDKKIPPDSSVQGVVVDWATKKPVGDVVVSLTSKQGKKEIRSDASGAFSFYQLPPGEFTLMIIKPGYKSCRKDFVVSKEGLLFKLSLEQEEEEGSDTWNPFRVLFDK